MANPTNSVTLAKSPNLKSNTLAWSAEVDQYGPLHTTTDNIERAQDVNRRRIFETILKEGIKKCGSCEHMTLNHELSEAISTRRIIVRTEARCGSRGDICVKELDDLKSSLFSKPDNFLNQYLCNWGSSEYERIDFGPPKIMRKNPGQVVVDDLYGRLFEKEDVAPVKKNKNPNFGTW